MLRDPSVPVDSGIAIACRRTGSAARLRMPGCFLEEIEMSVRGLPLVLLLFLSFCALPGCEWFHRPTEPDLTDLEDLPPLEGESAASDAPPVASATPELPSTQPLPATGLKVGDSFPLQKRV